MSSPSKKLCETKTETQGEDEKWAKLKKKSQKGSCGENGKEEREDHLVPRKEGKGDECF